ncbi:MAG: hypothetical protein HYT87_08160 [Nitrospirae bacterium]|nr:hypothetical protein [Nitrospirota bacterium]
MTSPDRSSLLAAVAKMLRPLARILVRNGVPYGTFADLARRAYVGVMAEESGVHGRKQSISRISILTGLSRKQVSRLLAEPDPHESGAADRYNRAARVISGWVRDRRFSGNGGRPAALRLEGRGRTFGALVRRYSGDVPSRAVLDELLRVGAVERVGRDAIRLKRPAYVPSTDEAGMLDILGTDVGDLISTIDHNVRTKGQAPFFQRKVSYDNLPAEVIQDLRQRTASKAQSWLEQSDRWLAGKDRDLNPSVRGSGRMRAGIGIYYFEEDVSEGGKES